MIIGIAIGPRRSESAESPGVDDPDEGAVIGTLKIAGQDLVDEVFGLEHLPGPAVGHPPHDAGQGRVRKHVLELNRQLGAPDLPGGLGGRAAAVSVTVTAAGRRRRRRRRREGGVHDDAAGGVLGDVAEVAVHVPGTLVGFGA